MLSPKNRILTAYVSLILISLASCNNDKVFEIKYASETGITFNNKIIEDSLINPISLQAIPQNNRKPNLNLKPIPKIL